MGSQQQKGSQGGRRIPWKEGLDVAGKELLPAHPILAQKCHQVGQRVLEGWEELE